MPNGQTDRQSDSLGSLTETKIVFFKVHIIHLKFQEEGTRRIQHSAEDERAEDEDGSEAAAVSLHLQMPP